VTIGSSETFIVNIAVRNHSQIVNVVVADSQIDSQTLNYCAVLKAASDANWPRTRTVRIMLDFCVACGRDKADELRHHHRIPPTKTALRKWGTRLSVWLCIAVPPNRRRRAPVDTIFDHVKRMRSDLHG
jgi:hypothetical protein